MNNYGSMDVGFPFTAKFTSNEDIESVTDITISKVQKT